MFFVLLVLGEMSTYLPAPQGQQIGVGPLVQGAGATLKTLGHSSIPTLGSLGMRGGVAQWIRVSMVLLWGDTVAMSSLCPHDSGDGEGRFPHHSLLGQSGVEDAGIHPTLTPPQLWQSGPTVRGALPPQNVGSWLWPLVLLLAMASLLHAKAWGLLMLGSDRGQLMLLSFHSVQLHVPREVPEAREDTLYGCGAQPGPSAYGGMGRGWGGVGGLGE